jgi:DNA polymerase III subunit epsilon
MWQRLFGLDFARRAALRKAKGALHDYLSVPFPRASQPCREVALVSLDFETTGLNPRQDCILSIGLVHVRDLGIRLDSTWHQVVRVAQDIPENSAIIHHITDDRAAAGDELTQVLPRLLQHLSGKVMLVHHARIEINFLDAACRALYGAPFVIPVIDTLALARRRAERRNQIIREGDLRLFNLCESYHLPRYKAHNALNDAIATAELFLAMSADMNPDGCCVGDFWVR